MVRIKDSNHFIVFLLLFCFLFTPTAGIYAAQETMKQVQIEMPVLRGDMWIKMSNDEKVAFIWGAGHVVTIEKVLMTNNPEIKRDKGFVARVVEASNNKQMNIQEVIDLIDVYYDTNSDQLEKPVFEVLWYETIVPRLSVNK